MKSKAVAAAKMHTQQQQWCHLTNLCVKTNKEMCFVFHLNDGIYYTHCNKDPLDTFETRE